MELHCNGKQQILNFLQKKLTKLKNLKYKLPFFNPPLYVSEIWAHLKEFSKSKLNVVFFTFSHCNSHRNYWPLEQLVSVDIYFNNFLIFSIIIPNNNYGQICSLIEAKVSFHHPSLAHTNNAVSKFQWRSQSHNWFKS